MMTLEEAIRHCEEKSCSNSECAAEHRQLAEWLTELQRLKEPKGVVEAYEAYYDDTWDNHGGKAMVVNNEHDIWFPSAACEDFFKAGAEWQLEQLMKDSVLCGGDGWFINNKRNCRKNGRFHKYYESAITHDKPLPMENGKDYRLIVIKKD